MGIYIRSKEPFLVYILSSIYLERRLKANRKASWRQNFVPNKYTINHFLCFILQSVLQFLSLALEPQPFQLLRLPICIPFSLVKSLQQKQTKLEQNCERQLSNNQCKSWFIQAFKRFRFNFLECILLFKVLDRVYFYIGIGFIHASSTSTLWGRVNLQTIICTQMVTVLVGRSNRNLNPKVGRL